MYQNTSKTSSAQRRLRAAYAARIRWVGQGKGQGHCSVFDATGFCFRMVDWMLYGFPLGAAWECLRPSIMSSKTLQIKRHPARIETVG